MRYLLFLFALPLAAHAEVMDKEPSLLSIVLSALMATAIAYLCARWKPWLLVLVLPAAGLWLGATAVETLDPFVGPAITREAGRWYLAAPWAGLVSVLAGTALGLWRRRCSPNSSSKPTPLRGAA
ncbi:hypothetical protein [Diaphorobacter nitroreducens]|uniref:hypothetical protein n=1 Tax=Diaphorobacter nitroreducens TaxID=164759 RepID=UPI0011E4D6B5|nr:hypothetical protein [Diaphorobacter nitroreducens]